MFNKVFKYDFKYVFRFWWIFAVATAGLSVLAGLLIRSMVTMSEMQIYNFLASFLSTMGIAAIIMIIGVFPIVALVACIVRYYKNLFSDEGYLTFTLPVKRSIHLNSKILNYVVFETMSVLVIILDILLILIIGSKSFFSEIIPGISQFFATIAKSWSIWLTFDVILVPILLLVYTLMSINLYYLSITIGSVISNRHKVLASIGVYLGMSAVMSFLQQIISYFTVDTLLQSNLFLSEFGNVSESLTIYLFLCTLLYGGISVAIYYINLYCIRNKLNLS